MSGITLNAAAPSDVQSGATEPTADSTTNLLQRDVTGNKADSPVAFGTAANALLSLVAYIKGLWNLLRNASVGQLNDEGGAITPSSSSSQGVAGSYVQLVASTAHTVVRIEVAILTVAAAEGFRLLVATGGAGSEVVKKTIRFYNFTTQQIITLSVPVDASLIPKGVRVAVAAINDSSATARAVTININLVEKND